MEFKGILFFALSHFVLIWLVAKMKKSKYKLIAFFLIAVSIFGYFTYNLAFENTDVDLGDFKGVSNAVGIYFSWLGSAFGNIQGITSKAIENNSQNDYEP
ncbi:MAG: hypothetical protein WD876_01465 [Candidatus Pacearchaeota archaeon]